MSTTRLTYADAVRVLRAVSSDIREPDDNRHAASRALDVLLEVQPGTPQWCRATTPFHTPRTP